LKSYPVYPVHPCLIKDKPGLTIFAHGRLNLLFERVQAVVTVAAGVEIFSLSEIIKQ
jgi:hypothetical protein